MERKENRDDYHEMIREKNKLKEKQRSVRKDDDEYDSESDSEYDDEEDESETELKSKAIKKIRQEIDGSDDESDENQDEDQQSSDDDSEIKVVQMDFTDKSKEAANKKKSKQATKASSIANMSFMKNAEAKKKELLKDQANDLVKQIQEDERDADDSNDDASDQDEDQGGGIFNASKKLKKEGQSVKALIDKDDVMKATKKIFLEQKIKNMNKM